MIVVIGILAAISIVAYNGVQERAKTTKRITDTTTYVKAIELARISTGKVLKDITVSTWSIGNCSSASGNLGNVEPKDLPKTHACWLGYYDNLNKIGAAAGVNLNGLRSGDSNGNPYSMDENEGETCGSDQIFYFTGGSAAYTQIQTIPRTSSC